MTHTECSQAAYEQRLKALEAAAQRSSQSMQGLRRETQVWHL